MEMVIDDRIPRRERKKLDTRRRILDSALALFSEHGFEAPTIEQIANHADVGKGTIYNYFHTKQEIALEHLIELDASLQNRFTRFSEQYSALDAILRNLLTYEFWLKRKDLTTVRVALAELLLHPESAAPRARQWRLATYASHARLFTRLAERGKLRPDANPQQIIEEWQALSFGLTCAWAAEGPPFAASSAALKAQTAMFAARWGPPA